MVLWRVYAGREHLQDSVEDSDGGPRSGGGAGERRSWRGGEPQVPRARRSGGGARVSPGAGSGRGSTGTPGGGRSRGGQARAPGRAVVGRETENGPGRCWVRNPGSPVGGLRTPKGRGGSPRSGGEPQGLRGWARIGRRIPRAPGVGEGRAGIPWAPGAGRDSQEHRGRAGRDDCWTALSCGGLEKGIRIARTPMLLRRASGTVRASD